MAENPREIVLDILLEAGREGACSHTPVKDVLDKYDYLAGQDKAFIKRLAEGTVETRIRLNYVIDQFSSVPVNKMKLLIRSLLQMSVYQLLYMDSVPDSAVCNEAVKLAGKRGFRNLRGFVNGVLRTVARQKDAIAWPDKEKDPTQWRSITYAMPRWIVELWESQYGPERTDRMLEALSAVYPVSIRFSTKLDKTAKLGYIAQMEKLGVQVSPSPLSELVYRLTKTEKITLLPGYAEGAFTVQDASSVLAVEAAGIRPGDFVMDVCAAPGGKSLYAAEYAGKVLSRDISAGKLVLIQDNIDRLGADNVEVQLWDATVTDDAYVEKADVVLMDVPCSGLGIMGKKRDIKYNISPESLAELVSLQRQIVEAGWRYVKPGGVLLYSTCTVRREENDGMCSWIAQNFPFTLEESRQFIPGEDACDGFFYGRFRRTAQ